ncbi:MAG: antitoxin of toxin-antitoxin stability system [Pseudomonadota bacterium]|nr:antitoxin of toxin-antitoxin stability system [Pseudomonadota bacterium]
MQVIETQVFSFDELDDSAKEKARDWWRQGGLDYKWFDCVYEEFQTITAMLGVTITTQRESKSPAIYFSGFCSQGDGASFEGVYKYKAGAVAKIKEYAPQDEELHKIAQQMQDIQCANFYQLTARITQSGQYCHRYTMRVDVSRQDDRDVSGKTQDALTECFRDLAHWLYKCLETEYDYLMSDEQVDELIRVNEYTFTEAGKRFG